MLRNRGVKCTIWAPPPTFVDRRAVDAIVAA